MVTLLFGGVLAAAVSLAAGLVVARDLHRLLLVLGTGLLLAALYFPFSYVMADTSSDGSRCHDCGYYLGRWWQPQLVVIIAVWNYIVWVVGPRLVAAVGLITRRRRAVASA